MAAGDLYKQSFISKSKREAVQELEAMSAAFTQAFWVTKDYDKAFYIGFQLEERLLQVSEADYPDKRKTYYKLGEAYYLFLDFHKSIELLENALAPVPLSFDDRTNLDALNILGICYANIGCMETSDDYFRATLLSGDIVLNRPIYNAYALSHLGCNAMLTRQYDKAIALSETVWPVLREETEDYGHLAGMCYCRGRSYLEKGDFKQASIWADSLVYFANKDTYNYVKRIKQAHLLRADYYTAMSDAPRSKVYNDSLVGVYRQSEELYTSQYIARAAQQYNGEKIADREQKLKISRTRLAIIAGVALMALAASAVILSLYRKKSAAYKALAQRAEEWAHGGEYVSSSSPDKSAGDGLNEPLTEEEARIMSLIDTEMTTINLYRETGLTAETLANRLSVHRNSLSKAINKSTGGNFNQYINGFRIKEAVRLLSVTTDENLYIDELYERVGFASYTSFYRAFKQFTGLSSAEFRKSRQSELKKQ